MKILFVQHRDFINGSGGTEKICSFLANGFSDLGHEVEIATNQNIEGKPVFPLVDNIKVTNIFDPNVTQKSLHAFQKYSGKNPLLWIQYKIKKKYSKFLNKSLYRKIGGPDGLFQFNLKYRSRAWKEYIDIAKPDLIITMSIGSLLEISYENKYSIPIINSTNGRPDYDYSDILWYRDTFEINLLKDAYKKLSGIQILFDSYKDFLPETFRGKSETVSNPVPQFLENELINLKISKRRYKVIHIGSLATDCKQQHLAIDIFASIAGRFPDWDLHFWGSGNDFTFLNNKIQNFNLQDRIFLNGFTNDPISKLKDSDIFIFPSRYEGFGLALAEAMSLGLPTLGFASCSGVNELIKHNKNGFLAQDLEDLKNYLEKLMSDSKLRSELGKNAHLEMVKYSPEKNMKKWSLFLKEFVL